MTPLMASRISSSIWPPMIAGTGDAQSKHCMGRHDSPPHRVSQTPWLPSAPAAPRLGWRNADDALLKEVAPVLSDNDAVTPIFPVDDPAWGTLTSLRDVDAVSSLYVISEKGTR